MRTLRVVAVLLVLLHAATALALEENWRVVEMAGEPLAANVSVTIAFGQDGRVSGRGGCNRFAGSYAQTGDRLVFGELAATRMACPPPLMEAEDRFFALLGSVTRAVTGEDGRLRLDCGDRQVLLLERAR